MGFFALEALCRIRRHVRPKALRIAEFKLSTWFRMPNHEIEPLHLVSDTNHETEPLHLN